MNQKNIGNFLKQLRKDKGLTQEQLAELFYVSSRTVSRWETGSNMPELSILIELADFYEVDIREILDGERKSEKMENETKETLQKVAKYAEEEKKKAVLNRLSRVIVAMMVNCIVAIFFGEEFKGILNGYIVSDDVCKIIMLPFTTVFGILVIDLWLFSHDTYKKIAHYIKKQKP